MRRVGQGQAPDAGEAERDGGIDVRAGDLADDDDGDEEGEAVRQGHQQEVRVGEGRIGGMQLLA